MEPMTRVRPRRTIQDVLALPEGVRGELLDGELYVTPSPEYRHQVVVQQLHALLRAYCLETGWGQALFAPLDVYLPTGDLVQPDILLLARDTACTTDDWVRGTPDLVVEVLSPSHPERDLVVKTRVLCRARASPSTGSPIRRRRGFRSSCCRERPYHPHGWFTDDTPLTSPGLPGISIRPRVLAEGL